MLLVHGGGGFPVVRVPASSRLAQPCRGQGRYPPGLLGNLADWGALGSALGGLATVVLAVAAIIGGTAGLSDWRARQRSEKTLADEQAESIRLERRRVLA